MAKRRADKELTDRNWDQEDEPEEAGQIELASENAMKGRHVLKGKRRGVAGSSQSKEFTGFSNFSFKPTAASTPFSFNVRSVTNGTSEKDEKQETEKAMDSENGQTKTVTSPNGTEKKKASYLSSLKNLNEGVVSWIKSHVEKNPYCILTPVFKDYEKHLAELLKNRGEKSDSMDVENKAKEETTATKTLPTFAFGNSFGSSGATTAPKVVKTTEAGFSFASSVSTATTTSTTETKPFGSGFQFGATGSSATTTTSGFPGFSFKTDTQKPPVSGFSFGVNKPSDGAASQEEDDEYVPPKAESTEVPEEGSVYSIKCKLFYQKEGAWTERGVGFLHLKLADEKLQMVVRADTTLGNIILNIIVSPSIPLKRQGKNNVSMICVPNPPVDKKADPSKPVPMLIRVKTGEDADKLLETMEEHRKSD